MSFQSSILGMIGTVAGAVKIGEMVKAMKDRPATITNAKPETQAKPEQPAQTQANKPAAKDEPVFIGGQQVSPEIAAKVRAAAQRKQQAEASLVLAQQEKREKRAPRAPKAANTEVNELGMKYLGMEAMR